MTQDGDLAALRGALAQAEAEAAELLEERDRGRRLEAALTASEHEVARLQQALGAAQEREAAQAEAVAALEQRLAGLEQAAPRAGLLRR